MHHAGTITLNLIVYLKKAWCKCFSHIFTRALENVVCLGESRLSQVNNSPRADVFPARLAMMLNFNISKVAYLSSLSTEREKIFTSGCHFWHPGRQPSSCLRPLISLLYTIFFCWVLAWSQVSIVDFWNLLRWTAGRPRNHRMDSCTSKIYLGGLLDWIKQTSL